MTLNDIARMLKVASVPRSKTVEYRYPNPRIDLFVPAQFVGTLQKVVDRLKLPHEDIRVLNIDTLDVRPNEHVLFKVTGRTHEHTVYPDGCDARELRRRRRETCRARNADVVIDFARVAS